LAGVLAAAGVAGPTNLAQAVTMTEIGPRFCQVKVALIVQEHRRLPLPNAVHLRSFLFERHLREQVGDALVDWS
jgi:hypothetical protein